MSTYTRIERRLLVGFCLLSIAYRWDDESGIQGHAYSG
ncbi:hypothetical protein BamMC406_5570 [Burkholderia ambifaria MC40-6]|uniref:Uncharacterized protein n=1 Tax=Burkholderia ambifaria (strain MC40-6) TaxID=398577 RepID=B1Z5G7_BURA4|nr:hypothetical protein BamMC406_5570 [Burkholderia ambifaria MC40-6]